LWLDISNVFVQKLQSQRLNIKNDQICWKKFAPCRRRARRLSDVSSINFVVKRPHAAPASFYI